MYSFQHKLHPTFNSKSPKTSNISYHTTIPEILDTFILSLVLVPKETRANTSKPFPNILSVAEVQSSRFFESSNSNQVLFLSNYNTQNSNPSHTFQYSKKSSHLTFLHHHQRFAFTSSTCIKYTPHHFISSLP